MFKYSQTGKVQEWVINSQQGRRINNTTPLPLFPLLLFIIDDDIFFDIFFFLSCLFIDVSLFFFLFAIFDAA